MRKQVYMFLFCLLSISKSTQAGPFSALGAYAAVKFNYFVSDLIEEHKKQNQQQINRIRGIVPIPEARTHMSDPLIKNLFRENEARAAAAVFLVTPTP